MASASLERRMLPAGAPSDTETPVRREDQDAINAFSRLNGRESTLETKLTNLESRRSDLEDAAMELELADDDELVPYRVGDAFVYLKAERVRGLLETKSSDLQDEIGAVEKQLQEARDGMEALKVQLYKRFGSSINLER